jgi:hypothetical protein
LIKNKIDIFVFWQLLSIYLAVRVLTFYLQIIPVGEEIALRWDLMNFELLSKDLLRTIYNLHFKPPLWNLLFGIFIKIFGVDYKVLGIIFHLFNIFLSFLAIYYFYLIAIFFKLTKNQIYIIFFIFFIFSLSFLYYETYIHYSHLTVFLFAQFSILYLKFSENHKLKYELYIYLTALFLAYTWSAFTLPFFMFVIFIGLTLIKFKKNILRSFIICCVFTSLVLILSFKNKIVVNSFANSTGAGMQLFTILNLGDNWETSKTKFIESNDYSWNCNFNPHNIEKEEAEYKKDNPFFDNTHPSLTGKHAKLNNVGYIYRSKKCLDIAIKKIKNKPSKFVNRVKFIFISNHGHFTFDHEGWDPKEWKKYFGFFYELNNNKYLSPIKVRSLQLYYILIYSFFILLTVKSLFQINTNQNKTSKSISSIFLIYAWLILIAHIGAGYEHERMRHTGHFLHIIFFIILLKNKFNYKSILQEYF